VTEDRERAARAIADRAKAVRKPLPRGVWILAAIVGLGCAIAAAIAFTRPAAPRTSTTPVVERDGIGLGVAVLAGFAVGVGVGIAIGRRGRTSGPS